MNRTTTLALHGGTPVRTEPDLPWPIHGDEERAALDGVLESGNWGGFPFPNERANLFAERFAACHGARFGLAAANGTVTLKVALRAVGVAAGDEVIVPPLTWIATATAALDVNAVPVFADVEPGSYCLDPEAVAEAVTPRTRAIVPVHLGCRMADMDRLRAIAERHDLALIEDCAHAHGARWNDRGAGSLGDLGSFSFQSSKLMTAGEGGALVTDDERLHQRCLSLVNCGRKLPGYDGFEGRVTGWNDRMTEWQAAVLAAQLDRLEDQTAVREANTLYLERQLEAIEGIEPLERDPRLTRSACFQFVLRYRAEGFRGVQRDRFARALWAEGIHCTSHLYSLVPNDPYFRAATSDYPTLRPRYGDGIDTSAADGCTNARRAVDHEAIWIAHPLFLGGRKEMDQVVEAIVRIQRAAETLLD